MGCDVYANSNEISCKKGDNKVIAEFPDVCLSPPSPPAGPVPVPYPDTSFSKDMQNGSKTVMIKDGEVMLKDQSFYQTSPLGDEAATNGLGANVITHVITGKTYFVAWSMDVKFEGQNVDRHLDLTTSNHNPKPGGTGPTGGSSASSSGGGGGRDPCKNVDCNRQQEKVKNLQDEVAKRERELREDPQKLPGKARPGQKPRETKEGHQQLLNEAKRNLARAKALYIACCDPNQGWDDPV